MTDNADRYKSFWTQFGRVVKEGLINDFENRDTLLDIASFASTDHAEQLTTLRQYCDRMKDGQQEIFYMTGESRSTIESSPHMEALRAKDFEVLLLTDPVDEMWVESVREFDGKRFQSIAKGQVDLDSEEEKETAETERDQQKKDFADLLAWMTTTLQENVKEVRLSSRLTTSPACIVGDTYDVTPTLEKMYRAMGQDVPRIKRILELNPTHPLVSALRQASIALGASMALLATPTVGREGSFGMPASRSQSVVSGAADGGGGATTATLLNSSIRTLAKPAKGQAPKRRRCSW